MKPIHIDFATHNLRHTIRHTTGASWILSGATLAASIVIAYTAWNLVEHYHSYKLEIRHLQTTLQARQTQQRPTPRPVISEPQATAVNRAIAQLNLPWRDVLDAIEAATPSTIALLSLEPDAPKHLIRVIAEAKTGESMIAYIEQLKRQAFFDSITLIKHETNEQDPHKPLRFQFEAQWMGAPE